MPTWKIVLIVRRQNAKEWKNIGEFELLSCLALESIL